MSIYLQVCISSDYQKKDRCFHIHRSCKGPVMRKTPGRRKGIDDLFLSRMEMDLGWLVCWSSFKLGLTKSSRILAQIYGPFYYWAGLGLRSPWPLISRFLSFILVSEISINFVGFEGPNQGQCFPSSTRFFQSFVMVPSFSGNEIAPFFDSLIPQLLSFSYVISRSF